MDPFGTPPAADPLPPGPEAFWDWWTTEGAAACEAGIERGAFDELTDELTARVHAVDDALVWELGPGRVAQHQLVVSAEGDPEARAAARRLLRAAPAASPTWEYADARRPDPEVEAMVLKIGEAEIDFASVLVAADRVGNHLDVRVHHPALLALPEQARNTLVFIALDAALGENECETWVGAVEAVLDPPPGATTLTGLTALVDAVRADSVGADGLPLWVLLQGEHDGATVMAAAQVPLAASWAPHLDTHVALAVPYAGATDQGLPEPGALDALRALEDDLGERVLDLAQLVAHETSAGVRTLHFYADSTTAAVGLLEAAVTAWEQGRVTLSTEPDPGWHAVRHLRT